MNPGEFVIAYLRDPKERLFCRVERMDSLGLVLKGLDIGSFEDWVGQVTRGDEQVIQPSTFFIPMSRVERLMLDETAPRLPSFQDRFKQAVGVTLGEWLEPSRDQ